MYVGIDIGATWTRVGVLERGVLAWSQRQPTAAMGITTRQGLVESLCELTTRAMRSRPSSLATPSIEAVGVAIPGLVDSARGVVTRAVNLPVLDGVALGTELEKKLGCLTRLVTDAQAATWGEYTTCDPRPARFVHLRLGSGVACGAVIDGAWAPLDEPRTTHAPTLIVDHSATARPCPCGLRGCLETIASGRALERLESEVGMTECVKAVGAALENLSRRFCPETVVLGGGALVHRPELLKRILAAGQRTGHGNRLEAARLGDNAGVVGAALLASV